MLHATTALLALMDGPRRYGTQSRREDAYANVVRRFGGPDDREALLAAFLRDPDRCDGLLWPLGALGDAETARRLHDRCIVGGALGEGMPSAVLHTLGLLGMEGIEEMLFDYARMAREGADWSAHVDAAYGLLSLPCTSILPGIRAEVEACYGRNLFPEYVPALAHKTGDPALLEGIFTLGATTASTDCNGGIVLGIALYGEAGLPYFHRVLADRHWEAWSTSTGTAGALFGGLQVLGMGVLGLFRHLQARMPDSPDPLHDAWIVTEMVEMWMRAGGASIRGRPAPAERASEVHAALFDYSSQRTDPSLGDLVDAAAARPDQREEAAAWTRVRDRLHELRLRVELRMDEEALEEEMAARR